MRGGSLPARAIAGIVIAVLAAGAAGAREATPPSRPQDTLTVIYGLRIDLELETHLLGREMETYIRLEERRLRLADALEGLYGELNNLIQDPGQEVEEEIAAKEAEVGAAEQEEIDVRRRLRESRQRILRGRERIGFLRSRLDEFRESLPTATESLTGTWEVTYMPTGEKGVFRIEQNGTLLGGDYVLDGGWTGSLQGTFVNGKVFLQRIDSRLGRSSEIQGYISSDGRSIKGSWQNFELTGPGPSSGAWTATKQETPSGEGEGP